MSGRLITIEGLDGAGKSTFAQGLLEHLDNPLLLREPGGTEFAEAVGQLVRGQIVDLPRPSSTRAEKLLQQYHQQQDQALAELFIFNAARADLIDQVLTPTLAEGRAVLLDRFYHSTIAYQGYGRRIGIELVSDICQQATAGLTPDRIFYLAIDQEERSRRLSSRPLDKIEASGDEFYDRVALGFETMAQEDQQRWVRLNAAAAPSDLIEMAIPYL